MDTLSSELQELKGFITELKADRAAQKEKEKRESWTKYTSMSLVFIAVLAAVATQWSGRYSSRVLVEMNNATLCQAKASDNWNYYQASSIKQNMYESLMKLSLPAAAAGGTNDLKFVKDFQAKIAKYEATKGTNMQAATDLEQQRDVAKAKATDSSRHGSGMGTAVSIFQISIAMGSICLVTKKKWLWYISLFLALLATGQMIAVIWFDRVLF